MTYTELNRKYGIEFEKRELPEFESIQRMQAERVAAELLVEARDTEITSFLRLAEFLKETEPGTEVIAYLLKRYFALLEEQRKNEPIEIGGDDTRRRRWRDDDHAPDDDEDLEDGGRKGRKRRKRKKRRGKGDDEDRSAPEPPAASGDWVRLFINRGSSDGYDDQRIRGLLGEVSEVSDDSVRRVVLRRTHSFAEVTEAVAEAAVAAAEGGIERDEKPVAIERARTRG
jgi:hypothetical protein